MNVPESTPRPQPADVSPPERRLPLNSAHLLQGEREVWIDHQGTLYCLKATSAGRLYLTK